MSAYLKLKLHLERHVYKRGEYKGSAPADSSRRSKSHFRVTPRGEGKMAVRMHNTDIITAYEDGRLILDCDGWAGSSTTKQNLQHALRLCGIHAYVGGRTVSSKHQLCYVNSGDGAVVYYDGMEIDGTGKVVSELKPFMARRRDRAQTKEFEEAVKASGFKDMFKLLHATCEADDREPYVVVHHPTLQAVLTEEVYANRWKPLVANYTWDTEARWVGSQITHSHLKHDASTTWSAIMTAAKKDMYEDVPTDKYRV